jgi:hypothetical protein
MSGINLLYSGKNLTQPAISYGPFPQELKVQLVFIFKDFINSLTNRWGQKEDISSNIWESIDNILRREHGLHILYDDYRSLHQPLASWYMVCQYFEKVNDIGKELDVVYAVCEQIENCLDPNRDLRSNYSPQQALSDVNKRLQQHGIGYRWQENEIIKVPSEFTYNEIIAPALTLLYQAEFENAQQEFISAFEHYKKGPGEYEEALTDCLKSIESVIKIIATTRKWTFNKNDTAKPLIALLIKEGLVPTYSESFLAGIRNTLESGVPTIRNKLGGHGKGAESRIVDEASMHYCINLTSAVILYLVQRHQEIPR